MLLMGKDLLRVGIDDKQGPSLDVGIVGRNEKDS
jgi:hypothetical protein